MSAWYFAYGGNMARSVFVERRGMCPTRSEAAVLEGYRLAFDMPGLPGLEPAFANVHPAPGKRVLGVLHRIDPADLARLDRMEAAGTAYRQEACHVTGVEAGRVSARVYRAIEPLDGLTPSRRYVSLLVEGAREFGLPEAWVRCLESHRPPRSPLRDALAPAIVRLLEVMMTHGVPVAPVVEALADRLTGRRPGGTA